MDDRGWPRRLFVALILPIALLARPVRALGLDLDDPLPVDPEVYMVEMPSGFNCWIREHKTPPDRVGMWLHVDSGSINEEEDERGLAHFLEHLAFRGSKNFPPGTLIKYFESIGLTFGRHQNASTGFDQTTYRLTLPDTKEETLRKGLLCMADFAFRLSLLQEEADKERGVVLEELRARKGPSQRIFEECLPILLPGSRVAERLPIGKEEVIKVVGHGHFESYYKTWYRPDNTTLLIVGDIDAAVMEELVADAFTDWQFAAYARPNADAGVKPYTRTRAAVMTDPEITEAEVSAVSVRPLEEFATVGDFRRALVDSLGTWIVNRRLGDMVREGTAPFQDAAVSKERVLGIMTYIDAEAEGKPDKWEPMLRSLLTELRRARQHAFRDKEFEDAKKATVAALEKAASVESTRDQRFFLRYMNECVGEGRTPISAVQKLELAQSLIPTFTRHEVWGAFRQNFSADARLILVILPEREGLEAPSEETLLALEKEVEAAHVEAPAVKERITSLLEREPAPGMVVEQEEERDLEILSVTLSNGVRAHLRNMDYKKDTVLVNITLAGGAIRETVENHGVTSVAALALKRPASQELTSTQIRDFMTGKKVSIGGSVSRDAVTVSIEASPEDLEEGLRLAHLLLTEPRIEAAALKVWKEQMTQRIEERKTNVRDQMVERADVLLSGDDPRLRFPTQEQVDALTLEQGQEWLEDMIRSAPVEVSFVGDLDRDRALELTRKYLGSLPPRPRADPTIQPLREVRQGPGPLSSTVEVDTITPKATAMVGWRGADWTGLKDRRCLQIAAEILSTRLRKEIRERRGLTYSPFCIARPAKAYAGMGQFVALLTADPETAAETAELTRSVMADFATEGPTEDEMDVVRKQFANRIETSQKEPRYWASILADLDYHGTKLSDVKEAREKYTTYTRYDLLEVLGKYVTGERRIQVIALPKEADQPDAEPPTN